MRLLELGIVNLAVSFLAIVAAAWISAPLVENMALREAGVPVEDWFIYAEERENLLFDIDYPSDHIPWWETYLKAASLGMDLTLLTGCYWLGVLGMAGGLTGVFVTLRAIDRWKKRTGYHWAA